MPQALLKLRVGLRGAGWRYEAHPLKVRSETQYLQAYLSLSAPYTPPYLPFTILTLRVPAFPSPLPPRTAFHFRNLSSHHSSGSGSSREISFVFNPRHRHIRLCNEKLLRFYASIFPHFAFLRLFTYFCGYYFWLMVDGMEFNILVTNSNVTLSLQNYFISYFINY